MKYYYIFILLQLFFVFHANAQLSCDGHYEIELEQSGTATLLAEDLEEGGNVSNLEISLNGIDYKDSIDITCTDNFRKSFQVYLRGMVNGVVEYCTSTVTALSADSNISLFTKSEAELFLHDWGYVEIDPKIFIDSVSRECGVVQLELIPKGLNLFTEGEYNITVVAYTTTDTVQQQSKLIVESRDFDEDNCYDSLPDKPVNMTYIKTNGSVSDLLPQNLNNLDSLFLESGGDSILDITNLCPRFSSYYIDHIESTSLGYKITRKWKIRDLKRNNRVLNYADQKINFFNKFVEFEFLFKNRNNDPVDSIAVFQINSNPFYTDKDGKVISRLPYLDSISYKLPSIKYLNMYDTYWMMQLLLGLKTVPLTSALHWTLDLNNSSTVPHGGMLSGVTSWDKILLERAILYEESSNGSLAGEFGFFVVDSFIQGQKVIKEYTTTKKGDVILGNGYCCDTTLSLEFNDILLNKGEVYEFGLRLKNPMTSLPSIMAVEINLPFQNDSIEIENIYATIPGMKYNILDENRLKIIFLPDQSTGINKYSDIFSIEIRSNVNSVLSRKIDSHEAFGGVVFANDSFYKIGVIVSDSIQSQINSVDRLNIKVYPNPASNSISIESVNSLVNGNGIIKIYDSVGRPVLQTQISSTVDISSLRPGIYTIRVVQGNLSYSEKLFIE